VSEREEGVRGKAMATHEQSRFYCKGQSKHEESAWGTGSRETEGTLHEILRKSEGRGGRRVAFCAHF